MLGSHSSGEELSHMTPLYPIDAVTPKEGDAQGRTLAASLIHLGFDETAIEAFINRITEAIKKAIRDGTPPPENQTWRDRPPLL